MFIAKGNGRSHRWLIRTVASLLVPSYIFAVCSRVYAVNPIAARVIDFLDTGSNTLEGVQYGVRDDVNSRTPVAGDRLQNFRQFLWVPGNNQAWAHFDYAFANNSYLGLVQAGPHSQGTSYYFPCGIEVGLAVIGWNEEKIEDIRNNSESGRTCDHQGARISLDSSGTGAMLPRSPAQASKALETAQTIVTPSPQYHYCTVAAKDRGWWVNWGTDENPCEKAYQSCSETGSADGCELIGAGDWSAREQDVLVTVGCEDEQLYTARGTGREVATTLISNVAREAKVDASKVCILNIYEPDDLIVAPATEDSTLVLAQSANGGLTVDALAGDVIIQSAQNPEGLFLEVGNRYIHPQGTVQPINVSEITQSVPMRIFLDPENWSPDNSAELEEYRVALSQPDEDNSDRADNPRRRRRNFFERVAPILGLLALAGIVRLATDYPDRGEDNPPDSPPENNTPDRPSIDDTQVSSAVPRISITPDSIDFGSVDIESEPESIEVTNNGTAPLSINVSVGSVSVTDGDATTTIANTGVFNVDNQCSNGSIAPGSSCTVFVRFTPPYAAESFRANLTISSNAENGSRNVSLSGYKNIPVK